MALGPGALISFGFGEQEHRRAEAGACAGRRDALHRGDDCRHRDFRGVRRGDERCGSRHPPRDRSRRHGRARDRHQRGAARSELPGRRRRLHTWARAFDHDTIGFIAGCGYLGKALVSMSVVALALTTYLGQVIAGLPVHVVASIAVLAITGLNVFGIELTSKLVIGLLAVLVVLLAIYA